MIEYIRDQLSQEELLAQLAEECMELGQSALKMRRVLDGSNPTPVSLSAAFANFEEEIADVLLCLKVLGVDDSDFAKYEGAMEGKLARWAGRLREMRGAMYG
jgi:hypothetical protein